MLKSKSYCLMQKRKWIRHDKGTTELKCIALVFQGWKLVKVEEA